MARMASGGAWRAAPCSAACSGATSGVVGRCTAYVPPALRAVTAQRAVPTTAMPGAALRGTVRTAFSGATSESGAQARGNSE